MFLVAILNTGTSQVSETRPKANSIKPAGLEDAPTPATNRSTTAHSRITKKYNILKQVFWFFIALFQELRQIYAHAWDLVISVLCHFESI